MLQFSFLCAGHKNSILKNPRRAESLWYNWVGNAAAANSSLEDAEVVSMLGCAWEVARGLLVEDWPTRSIAIERFGYSAVLLHDALASENLEAAREILRQSESALITVLEDGVEERAVLHSLAELSHVQYAGKSTRAYH